MFKTNQQQTQSESGKFKRRMTCRREFAAAAANRSLVWAGHNDPGGGQVCHGPQFAISKCQMTGQVTLEISKRYRWVRVGSKIINFNQLSVLKGPFSR